MSESGRVSPRSPRPWQRELEVELEEGDSKLSLDFPQKGCISCSSINFKFKRRGGEQIKDVFKVFLVLKF